MPTGTDVIPWEPRVGDTGDDRYTWPEDHGLDAGPSDIYSDPPTFAQVLKGRGFNQLLAEIRRRRYSIYWNMNTYTLPSYTSGSDPIIGNTTSSTSSIKNWIAIKYAVNEILGFERHAAVTWPTIPEMPWYWPRWDDPISIDFKQWMLTARKALALDHVRVYPVGHSYISYARDTYPPDQSGSFYHTKSEAPVVVWGGNMGGIVLGQKQDWVSSGWCAYRGTFKFNMPALSIAEDGLEFDPDISRLFGYYREASLGSYVSFVAELREATKLIYDSGDWSDYGNLVDSWTIPASPIPQSKEHVVALPPAGLKYYFLNGEKERLDVSPGGANRYEYTALPGRNFYMKLYTA